MTASYVNNYVRVCGIYADGEFLCAAESKESAQNVFESVLDSYLQNNTSFQGVSFLQQIEYIEGLYPEKSEDILDSRALYSFICDKDSPISIKQTKLRSHNKAIPFETETRKSESFEKGTTKVLKEGVEGQLTVTELVCFVDGVEESLTVISQKETQKPQNRIVVEGTKEYTAAASGYTWPTKGAYNISSYYGNRDAEISGWSFHGGIDIIEENGNSAGLSVVAAAAGTVEIAYSGYYGYGHTVVINHGNGIKTRYAHMLEGSINVKVGDKVDIGQKIGLIGSTGNSTGPHLHFEIIVGGKKVNPLPYIQKENN